MEGSTSWVSRAKPNRFTSNWYRASSSGRSSTAPYSPKPALLTRMSVPPRSALMRSTPATTSSSLVTSILSAMAPKLLKILHPLNPACRGIDNVAFLQKFPGGLLADAGRGTGDQYSQPFCIAYVTLVWCGHHGVSLACILHYGMHDAPSTRLWQGARDRSFEGAPPNLVVSTKRVPTTLRSLLTMACQTFCSSRSPTSAGSDAGGQCKGTSTGE